MADLTAPVTVTTAPPQTPEQATARAVASTMVSRPGWLTSEFTLSTLTVILGTLLASGVFADGSVVARMIGASMTLLASLGYTYGRSAVKAAVTKASAILPVLILGAVAAQPSCAASQRESTIKAALVTVDASREAFLAYDSSEQATIVAAATSLEQGKSALAEYRARRSKVETAFGVAYRTIAVATTLNDQLSLDGIKAAIVLVSEQVHALMGGAK